MAKPEPGLNLARWTAKQEVPDGVLLDLQLPDITGHEVFQRLRPLPQLAAAASAR